MAQGNAACGPCHSADAGSEPFAKPELAAHVVRTPLLQSEGRCGGAAVAADPESAVLVVQGRTSLAGKHRSANFPHGLRQQRHCGPQDWRVGVRFAKAPVGRQVAQSTRAVRSHGGCERLDGLTAQRALAKEKGHWGCTAVRPVVQNRSAERRARAQTAIDRSRRSNSDDQPSYDNATEHEEA